ncbi:MAG TPA: heme-binding protein [Thermoanaerobaculia bacterium]|nr:heme-binding protein [Thermoanaerobaculia bacterium]
MRTARCAIALVLAGATAAVPLARAQTSGRLPGLRVAPGVPPVSTASADCILPPALPQQCVDGAIGNASPDSFNALTAAEVNAIVQAAAASLDTNTMTVAVVDRAGRVLALFRKPGADPAMDDQAVGVARTAAFFSHNQAPLSSRTVRFISGIHFPPGITNTPNAALYGIENTNRGCDFNVSFNTGKCVPRARSANGLPCNATDASGCGPGIVTGKHQPADSDPTAVNAGGISLYRIPPSGLTQVQHGIVTGGKLAGGIGVVGVPGDSQLAEFAAVTGAFGALNANVGAIVPVPAYPLPDPGNVFIDGLRLPFLGPDQRLTFDQNGLPNGLRRLSGTAAGNASGTMVVAAANGGCAENEYLSGPVAGSQLSQSDVDGIVQRAVSASKRTRGIIRLPLNSYARMVMAVADLDGSILAIYRMPDATVFSIDVAVAKARNVIYFSSSDPHVASDLPGVPSGVAVTNRTIGFGAQPLFPPGIDSSAFHVQNGPFYPLFLHDLAKPCSQGSQLTNANRNGIVFFPGATPLYRNGKLVGGLGISGDGVEQDDYVTYLAAGSFLPSQSIWADQTKIDGVRLPMFKFPRQPEGVTECGGKPCD